jgi:glycosyltransferase involved in cell wall biosynthesis
MILNSQPPELKFVVSKSQLNRDFWLNKLERLLGSNFFRGFLLLCKVKRQQFELVHFLDFQTAAFLMAPMPKTWKRLATKLAVSNWGSDIYWHRRSNRQSKLIRKVLSAVDFYSAECTRDIHLARDFGYEGPAVRLLNGGGVQIKSADSKAHERKKIVVKGYQDVFGEAEDIVGLLLQEPEVFEGYEVVFVSAARSVVKKLKEVQSAAQVSISFSAYQVNRYSLGAAQVSNLLSDAKIFVAKSKSDGASTMALEAMAQGCIPIQSPTSCLGEYLTPAIAGLQPRTNSASDFLISIVNALELPGHEAEALAFDSAKIAREAISRESTSVNINNFYLKAVDH